ncbi:ARM repeat-containing protein [Piedraia hortae CBS 480.64]|uniref:eIF-2-alpha kinase activator GCN1 n=1 Tax=Piedraia hortae CBS 480.64 TaxID=1314780 RepID=A0A6A7BV08_9PEZI|nr:ARM repeat-containing protein [Piedraia hortae CBS 480.64]
MATEDNGLGLALLSPVLLSSSATRRIAELNALQAKVAGATREDLVAIAALLFDTYPLYVDTQSRHTVEQCLDTIAATPAARDALSDLIIQIEKESSKPGIAPAQSFVLVRWSSLFIQRAALDKSLWTACGKPLIKALTNALGLLFSAQPKGGTLSTARRVSRRAIKGLVKADFASEALDQCITDLTTKGAPHNTLTLGIIAECCKDLPKVVETRKNNYLSFYLREILASRVHLPPYISTALNEFWANYITKSDLTSEVIPSVEKSLLRAPEIVLNDLIAPMILSLPDTIDLSDILVSHLLKPLLSNAKSTNPTIRNGMVHTFAAISSHSHNETLVSKTSDEILSQLKTIKTTDQRVVYAQMLQTLPPNPSLTKKLLPALTAIASKEANETSAGSILSVLCHILSYALNNELKPEKEVIDAFVTGLGEKRLPMRKLWALKLADLIWTLPEDKSADLMDRARPKLEEILDEVLMNPNPAVVAGQVPVAYAAVAVLLMKGSTGGRERLAERLVSVEPKPSFLISARVYTKVGDLRWFSRALMGVFGWLPEGKAGRNAWAQGVAYLIANPGTGWEVRKEMIDELQGLYLEKPEVIVDVVVDGLWRWCEDYKLEIKDSTAVAVGCEGLYRVVRAICPADGGVGEDILRAQMVRLLVLCRPQLIPRASWVELCLHVGCDPGLLASRHAEECLSQILTASEHEAFQEAAYSAAADLAFVAPEILTPKIVAQISQDLNPAQLTSVGPTEAAIYRTPEGTAFIDVLSTPSQAQAVSKNIKDYDVLKWEADLRSQLAQKKGQTKKLTPEEQEKINTQLSKESEIRHHISTIVSHLKRGIGIINALITGPTDAEAWFGPLIQLLFQTIQAGASLILSDAASISYLNCSSRISPRLGAQRQFIGVATLRAAGITPLPSNLTTEQLSEQVTRLLYRLRSLGEQRPLDPITLSYTLPLILQVLDNGGIACTGDEADEQIVLAIEFLSFHTTICADIRLPQRDLLRCLIAAMQRYAPHFRQMRDVFTDLCRSVSPTIGVGETAVVVKGVLVPDPLVRSAVLSALSDELSLTEGGFYEEIWLACHDDVPELGRIAREIWEENGLTLTRDAAGSCLPYLLEWKDGQVRRAAARAVRGAVGEYPVLFEGLVATLKGMYVERAEVKKPELDRFGMPVKKDLSDPWEAREGIAFAFKELAQCFPAEELVPFLMFLVEMGPFCDRDARVRASFVDAATRVVALRGEEEVEALMDLCEGKLKDSSGSKASDLVNEAVVIVYGALARHLPRGDARIQKVVDRLLWTLSTPSESVQYAIAQCLPPLVRASSDQAGYYLQKTVEETLHGKPYATRRGAAYGLAGIVKGRGIVLMKECRLMSTLRAASENKKDANERQGAFLAYELLSLLLNRVFEPYVISIVPQLLVGFGDSSADVREACLDAAKTCFSSLSSYGVKKILPMLLEGLDEPQWRSKKGASDSLGAMAYLDPQQLAISLPDIIPPLTEVLNDSHKEVRASANRSLKRFGDVITNPEVKSQVDRLLKALSDPTRYTDDALDALIKVNFVHYLDAPSLALVVRILERGLGERSTTKRKAAQIIGSLAHLTERRDLVAHLPILVAGLKSAVVDPVPATRATASKALGSLIEKLGEDVLPELIPELMHTLRSDTGAGDRLGSAQALSEVLAGLGTTRLEETLPTMLQNVSSSKPSVREGFMSLFIFLPACFGQSFANYLSRIIPAILGGLADDVESIRETSLRAARLLIKNFASRSVDLLLPELERGLADDSYRIRLSSVELVGDLLFNLTGISGKSEAENYERSNTASQSLLEVLGVEKRDRILSGLYICRCDTSGLVRTAAVNVWKALVSTPRTLRELIPTLTQFLIRRLANSNMEQKVIASNALGELIRKAGEGVLGTLLPTLEEGLHTATDRNARQGICIALKELIQSASSDSMADYEGAIIAIVRTALVDPDADVREAAAEAFDALQRVVGKRAIDQVLPHLLNLLRSEGQADVALSGLLTLLTESSRSNVILPNLLPTLLTSPMTAFNARALASLAEVASSTMTRRLPQIINALMDDIVATKDETLKAELDAALDTVLLSVDDSEGLNTMMSVMLALTKNDDHHRRAAANNHLARFVEKTDIDFTRYYADLVRVLLIAFDDKDEDVVKAAWLALSTLTSRLRKDELEALVTSTRQSLNHVGVPGHPLPGFSLPKGIQAVLPIFLQGLMNGSAEQRTQAALAISDVVARTSPEGLKPFVTQITGPLIRVVSERSTDLKAAILLTINNLLDKIPTLLKPFLPQLQRTFTKSLADPSSEVLRTRAARALGTLIKMTPRIDPLISELVTGSKSTDAGVRNAMLTALYEVVSQAGSNMNDASRTAILGLIDSDVGSADASVNITFAKLLAALVCVLPKDAATSLIKTRILTENMTPSSVLALNAVLAKSPTILPGEAIRQVIIHGISSNNPFISSNGVMAAGKYLLSTDEAETIRPLIESLAKIIAPGNPSDARRLALVVVRTVTREKNSLIVPRYMESLVPAIFSSVRDPVLPVKLAAEAAYLAVFSVLDEESALFEKYMAGPGASLQPNTKRSLTEYQNRVAVRLGNQAKERREAEGGQGGLGLQGDEVEDLREVMAVGRVEVESLED